MVLQGIIPWHDMSDMSPWGEDLDGNFSETLSWLVEYQARSGLNLVTPWSTHGGLGGLGGAVMPGTTRTTRTTRRTRTHPYSPVTRFRIRML